jgi:hypothetical protein
MANGIQQTQCSQSASIDCAKAHYILSNTKDAFVPLISHLVDAPNPLVAHSDSLEKFSADPCICTPAVCPREGGKVCFNIQIVLLKNHEC